MKKVDMSEQAILRRLKTVDRLRELCLALAKAKKVSNKDPNVEVVPPKGKTSIRDGANTDLKM